jgi:hypothetical protein
MFAMIMMMYTTTTITTAGGSGRRLLVEAFALSSSSSIGVLQHYQQHQLRQKIGTTTTGTAGFHGLGRRHHHLGGGNYCFGCLRAHSDDAENDMDNSSSGIPDPDDYDFSSSDNNNNDDDEEEEEDGLSALANKSLGISLSAYLPDLSSPDNISTLQSEAKTLVNSAFDARLSELSELQNTLDQEAQRGNERRIETSKLNAIYENQKLMERIDALTTTFLEKNQEEREGTIRAANADERMGRSGMGVNWGSWGSTFLAAEGGGGGEAEVIVDGGRGEGGRVGEGASGDDSAGGMLLLGGVDAALLRQQQMRAGSGGNDDDDVNDASSFSTRTVENRVLIVMDDKKVR